MRYSHLGVKPVGTISGRGQQTVPNYLKDKVGDDVTLVGSVSEVNYDKVASLTPDLILADSTGVDKRSEAYKTLQDICSRGVHRIRRRRLDHQL